MDVRHKLRVEIMNYLLLVYCTRSHYNRKIRSIDSCNSSSIISVINKDDFLVHLFIDFSRDLIISINQWKWKGYPFVSEFLTTHKTDNTPKLFASSC